MQSLPRFARHSIHGKGMGRVYVVVWSALCGSLPFLPAANPLSSDPIVPSAFQESARVGSHMSLARNVAYGTTYIALVHSCSTTADGSLEFSRGNDCGNRLFFHFGIPSVADMIWYMVICLLRFDASRSRRSCPTDRHAILLSSLDWLHP